MGQQRFAISPVTWQPCELCGRTATQRHHVFPAANRKHSETHGLVANLCLECHARVHSEYLEGLRLKRKYQARFLKTHSVDEWMSIFGRNYL